MFLSIFLISLALLILAMSGMGISILLKKKGRFPAYRVGHNRQMAKIGITCVKHEEIRCHRKKMKEEDCAGCGS
jgi:hypothetical protein